MKGSTRNPDHEKGFFFIREVILKCEKKMPTNLNFEVGFCSKIFINHEKTHIIGSKYEIFPHS